MATPDTDPVDSTRYVAGRHTRPLADRVLRGLLPDYMEMTRLHILRNAWPCGRTIASLLALSAASVACAFWRIPSVVMCALAALLFAYLALGQVYEFFKELFSRALSDRKDRDYELARDVIES